MLTATLTWSRSGGPHLIGPAVLLVATHVRQMFTVKYMNIVDPLDADNNLGRSVARGNFERIKAALKLGFEKLSSALAAPTAKELAGLFTSIERRAKELKRDGQPAAIPNHVPATVVEYSAAAQSAAAAQNAAAAAAAAAAEAAVEAEAAAADSSA